MNHKLDAPSHDCCAAPGLIPVDEALSRILSEGKPVEQTELLSIAHAAGRVLADDVASGIHVPGYDNSAMDGYAVNSEDCVETGVSLPVSQRIPAGQRGTGLEPGTAARIFTGAPVPEGADAVVMQEYCQQQDDRVSINTVVKAGENIRRAGEDIEQGSVVLEAGTLIRPQEQGLLASVGLADIKVRRKLKVATFFTGDELVEPGHELDPGQIYNSNRYTLNGLLRSAGCEIKDYGIVPDTLEATLDVLKQAAANADLVITSGGVSVGEEDYVRIALEQLGELNMWRINMKPGKPVAFGKVSDALFLGLPGNPVSVYVTFLVLAQPLLQKMQGVDQPGPVPLSIRAGFEWKGIGRQEYLRVRIKQDASGPIAELFPNQGSGVLSSVSWADGLVVIEPGMTVSAGDVLSYLPFPGSR
ncbi:MAG: molybdopterin molybdotransferase MoeA [Thiotrichales bacterium]|nr:MAG: molybdopterin molybdotransferase MoeA [Thiotrichales bacterium]